MAGSDKRALRVLTGMLRLAEYFERGRRQVIRDLRCHLDLDNRWLQIEALAEGDATMEIWDAGRNIDVLEQALGLQVELVAGVWLDEKERDSKWRMLFVYLPKKCSVRVKWET